MAGLAVTVESASTGEPWGSLAIGPLTATGTIVPVVLGPTINSGANTITVPTGSSGMVFVPPATNTNTLQYKGVSGDTGTSMPEASFFVVLFNPVSPPASIVVTAGGSVGLCQVVFF